MVCIVCMSAKVTAVVFGFRRPRNPVSVVRKEGHWLQIRLQDHRYTHHSQCRLALLLQRFVEVGSSEHQGVFSGNVGGSCTVQVKCHAKHHLEIVAAWRRPQELGYIVPEAVSEEDQKFPHWTTEIRLPFKEELGNEEKAQYAEKTCSFDFSLFLFDS